MNNLETVWEDDWENSEIPDLLTTIKNKENELKFLEEIRLMEEDGKSLVEELFDEDKRNKRINDNLSLVEPITSCNNPSKVVKKEKPKELIVKQEKKKQEQQEKQKERSQNSKAKKQLSTYLKETFGEADIDEYDEMYGDFEDKF